MFLARAHKESSRSVERLKGVGKVFITFEYREKWNSARRYEGSIVN